MRRPRAGLLLACIDFVQLLAAQPAFLDVWELPEGEYIEDKLCKRSKGADCPGQECERPGICMTGACRGEGWSPHLEINIPRRSCEDLCASNPECAGFEYRTPVSNCEIHLERVTKMKLSPRHWGVECALIQA